MTRSVRNKVCKGCNFSGKVNGEEKCGNCAEKSSEVLCGVCSKDVDNKDNGLQCDLCQLWLHAQCERVGVGLYRELQKEEETPWVCTKCITQAKKYAETIRRMREERENMGKEKHRLDNEVKELMESLGVVERENRSLREEMKSLRKTQERETEVAKAGTEGAGKAREYAGVVKGVLPASAKPGAGATPDSLRVREETTTAPPVGQDPEVAVVAEVRGAEALPVAKERAAVAAPPRRVPQGGKVKWPIVCVGDSMVRNAHRYMAMRGENSKLVSLSGKGIEEVVETARESMRGLQEGMLILQGGGNGLRQLGPEQTVRKVMECVREVKRVKKVRVAVVGVLGRPKESSGYEELRKETNRLLRQEVLDLKVECGKREGDYGVSFLDLDGALPPGVYGRDGVHLDGEGDRLMCRRFLEWVTATERLCEMREKRQECERE